MLGFDRYSVQTLGCLNILRRSVKASSTTLRYRALKLRSHPLKPTPKATLRSQKQKAKKYDRTSCKSLAAPRVRQKSENNAKPRRHVELFWHGTQPKRQHGLMVALSWGKCKRLHVSRGPGSFRFITT